MQLAPDLVTTLETAGLTVKVDAPLVKRTWWRVGGAADGLVDVRTLDELVLVQQTAHHHGVPVFVLGNASNLLVSDAGIRGLVVRLTGELASYEARDAILHVGGGLKLIPLVSRMQKHGWTGLEMLAGVPGTVGGAVRMNAGTHLGEVVDALLDVDVVHRDGRIETLSTAELDMQYRICALPDGAIVARARFRLTDADPEESRAIIQGHLARRKATQPIDKPTCGSTFRNPPGDHAGRLIEAAGLKGFRIGQAVVSEKHANFIENDGGATAADIRRLLEHVKAVVLQEFGVELHQEVHYAGDWSDWPA